MGPSFKIVFLKKKVLAGPMNNAHDLLKKCWTHKTCLACHYPIIHCVRLESSHLHPKKEKKKRKKKKKVHIFKYL